MTNVLAAEDRNGMTESVFAAEAVMVCKYLFLRPKTGMV